MPIGLVSDDDFLQELNSFNPRSNTSKSNRSEEVVPSTDSVSIPLTEVLNPESDHGRNEGDVNVPDSLRQIIGEDAAINGRQSALGLAGLFGISPSSVSAYAKGATSTTTYNTPSKSIISHINKSRRRAIKKAQITLDAALGSITQDKLDYTDAKDLAGIAKDMSVIIKNLEPQQEPAANDDSKTPQFVIFAPQFRSEQSFETIVVNE
jgi:predicted transcriptional regulator